MVIWCLKWVGLWAFSPNVEELSLTFVSMIYLGCALTPFLLITMLPFRSYHLEVEDLAALQLCPYHSQLTSLNAWLLHCVWFGKHWEEQQTCVWNKIRNHRFSTQANGLVKVVRMYMYDISLGTNLWMHSRRRSKMVPVAIRPAVGRRHAEPFSERVLLSVWKARVKRIFKWL